MRPLVAMKADAAGLSPHTPLHPLPFTAPHSSTHRSTTTAPATPATDTKHPLTTTSKDRPPPANQPTHLPTHPPRLLTSYQR